ncbi:M10 family metallopeptidase C-terminal domain-containing protein, partial [Acidisphaera sp. L21]|uniref:M10 family metallopeptidase C-terminal domain-containing protein n=1 Tax=Acidisphaera sp. L21 TaxID=1641851 RepID=UPI00131DB9D2
MPQNAPNSSELATVSYINGLNPDGTVASTSFASWTGSTPTAYDANSSSLSKWDNDASGNTLAATSAAGTGGGTVTYAFDPASSFTPAQMNAFIASLTLWSDETNISFAAASSVASADVEFTLGVNTGSGELEASHTDAAAGSTAIPSNVSPSAAGGTSAEIVIETNGTYGTLGSFANGGYSYATLIHEIGHLVGLGHPGPYNDGDATGAEANQLGVYDSRQWTAMSYIEPNDTKAAYYSQYSVTGTSWLSSVKTTTGNTVTTSTTEVAPQTPMMLDILAAQQLYGTPTKTALSGGQVFGFNTNITDPSKAFFDFTVNTTPVVTLWDAGIGNTLDLSGYTTGSVVNLNPGSFSSAGGLTNNIGIAYGTAIDTAIGGTGNDIFTLNNDSDKIFGGGGSDTAVLVGASTAYTLHRVGTTVTAMLNGTNVIDTLQAVQTLQFSDKAIAASAIDFVPVPPNYSIAALAASQPDGTTGTTSYTFAVTRTGDSTQSASLTYTVQGSGTSPVPASLFAATSGTVTFAAGDTTEAVTVNVAGARISGPETFTATISSAAGAAISNATATGTILSPTSQVLNNVDGTSSAYNYILSATVYSTITQYSSLNGNGSVVSNIVDNADSTALLYAYNPSPTVT